MKNAFLKKLFPPKNRFKFDFSRGIPKHTKRRLTWKKVLIICGYTALGFLLLTATAFAWFSKDLPTPSKIANTKPAISTKIYDRTGKVLLYETGDQKRTIIKSDEISQYLKDATVSAEDANFYRHHGVDVLAIFKAVGDKLLGRTAILRGGSTITQQYVKNTLLTSDRSMVRKIKEAILAVELEFMYSKDEILTMYLNEIPYGSATAGAEAAAQTYYGKSAKDLTLGEAATLAAVPQAPTYYSPYGTHVDDLILRRNYVLEQMVKNGKITQEEADSAEKEDTTTVGIAIKARHDSILAPHFAMYVLEQVAAEYGEEKIQKEGLEIITTLDYKKQKAAEAAIASGMDKVEAYGGSNAALVAVDPKTGEILSMVGSKDYFDTSIDGNVNVADSARQPGSSFKPFAYATAFKKPEFSPSRIIYDFQTNFGGTPAYIPHNYNGKSNGPVTMRQALSNSLNIPAVKVMALAGIDNVLRTASDLGITTLTQRDRYGLSLVLGSGEVKPIEMAGAFSVFANGGVKHETKSILKVTDSKGKTIYEYDQSKDKGEEVLDPQIAYEISNILSDNNARSLVFGTRSPLYFSDRTVAAKTGTTNDFKDAWTVGYTPSIAVAIWTGNSDATVMHTGADGSIVAAPIFHSFIEKALAKVPNEAFKQPEGIEKITVEKYSNKLPTSASREKTTDIFASWQVPKEKDDIHQIIKVCKGTNLIAPDNAPASLIQEKVYADLHSERPDDPNWENPVRAWAKKHGMAQTVPTAQCDINAVGPTISISSPSNNSSVSGPTKIYVNVQSSSPIKNVVYSLDGVVIGTIPKSPYSLTYNFSSISSGNHTLEATATNKQNMSASSSISINITDTENTINNLSVDVSSGAPPSATATWTTINKSSSLISYSYPGSEMQTQSDNTLKTNHSLILSNLMAGQTYSYTITSVDEFGNAITKDGTFTVPLDSEQTDINLDSRPNNHRLNPAGN